MRDISGRALPGVQVLVRGVTGDVTAVTDGTGEYRLSLPPGTYALEFMLHGFKTTVVDGITVAGGTTRRQDAVLALGSISETVTGAPSAGPVQGIDQGMEKGAGGVVGGVVGGVPAAPPPPVGSYLRDVAPRATAADLGELFEYRIDGPVTVAKNESALVPILNAPVEVERVSLWSRSSGSGRPLRAVWLTNTSGLTLDGGTFSVIDADAFAGEGLMDSLDPGERRLLSYAADLGVLMSAGPEKNSRRLVRVRAHDGIVVQESEERSTTVYRARNEDAAARTVIIEHPRRNGWELAGGPEPVEQSPEAYRFRLEVKGQNEMALEIQERRTSEVRVAIGRLDTSYLETWVKGGLPAADLERALAPILETRRELAALDTRFADLNAERDRIFQDQERLRENLKSLGRSSEERQLVERYTRQLDQQEGRIEALDQELASVREQQQRLQRQLNQQIGQISFEVGAM